MTATPSRLPRLLSPLFFVVHSSVAIYFMPSTICICILAAVFALAVAEPYTRAESGFSFTASAVHAPSFQFSYTEKDSSGQNNVTSSYGPFVFAALSLWESENVPDFSRDSSCPLPSLPSPHSPIFLSESIYYLIFLLNFNAESF